MTPTDLPNLRALIANEERIWLVYSHDWYTDPEKLIPTELSQHYQQMDAQEFTGLQILRYEKQN